MSKKEELISDVAELNKAIDSWGNRGQKWAREGHVLALSALARLGEHGDVGPVNRLYLAMPKGTKSSAMAEYLLAFGKLVPTEGDNAKAKPFTFSKEKNMNMEGAAKKPWYEFKPEPTVLEVFDVQGAIRAFLKSTEAKAAKAQTATGLEFLDQIKSLLPTEAEAEEVSGVSSDPLATA